MNTEASVTAVKRDLALTAEQWNALPERVQRALIAALTFCVVKGRYNAEVATRDLLAAFGRAP